MVSEVLQLDNQEEKKITVELTSEELNKIQKLLELE
ncbi:replication protein, partial [Bacillus pseudomycoides]